MSEYRVVCEYRYPVGDVWRVMTEPEYVAQWTASGRGGRPEGFTPVVGTPFRLVGKPTIGWGGVVFCDVLAVDPPHLLQYTWRGEETSDAVSTVTYRLQATPIGTRLTWEHTGFTGAGGFVMSRLLGHVRRTMLTAGIPAVLATQRPEQGNR